MIFHLTGYSFLHESYQFALLFFNLFLNEDGFKLLEFQNCCHLMLLNVVYLANCRNLVMIPLQWCLCLLVTLGVKISRTVSTKRCLVSLFICIFIQNIFATVLFFLPIQCHRLHPSLACFYRVHWDSTGRTEALIMIQSFKQSR